MNIPLKKPRGWGRGKYLNTKLASYRSYWDIRQQKLNINPHTNKRTRQLPHLTALLILHRLVLHSSGSFPPSLVSVLVMTTYSVVGIVTRLTVKTEESYFISLQANAQTGP